MDREEFESKVLELWTKSQVPLTEANLRHLTDVPERTLGKWIDALVKERVLSAPQAGEAPSVYKVPGRQRSAGGLDSYEEFARKRVLVEEAKKRILAKRAGKDYVPDPKHEDIDQEERSTQLVKRHPTRDDLEELEEDEDDGPSVVSRVGRVAMFASGKALVALDKPLSMLDKPMAKGNKSLLASTGLSLFGPLGWLYAGSFREAVPASLAFVAVASVLGYIPSFLIAPFTMMGMAASSLVGLTYAWRFNRNKGRTPLLLSPRKSRKKDKKKDNEPAS